MCAEVGFMNVLGMELKREGYWNWPVWYLQFRL